jgi:hypothetical protein
MNTPNPIEDTKKKIIDSFNKQMDEWRENAGDEVGELDMEEMLEEALSEHLPSLLTHQLDQMEKKIEDIAEDPVISKELAILKIQTKITELRKEI